MGPGFWYRDQENGAVEAVARKRRSDDVACLPIDLAVQRVSERAAFPVSQAENVRICRSHRLDSRQLAQNLGSEPVVRGYRKSLVTAGEGFANRPSECGRRSLDNAKIRLELHAKGSDG